MRIRTHDSGQIGNASLGDRDRAFKGGMRQANGGFQSATPIGFNVAAACVQSFIELAKPNVLATYNRNLPGFTIS
jgi:hypothetical protein